MDSDTLKYVETACKAFNVTPDRVMATSRKPNPGHADDIYLKHKDVPTASARRFAWWMIRNESKKSFPQIARLFQCDHAAVLRGCKWVEEDEERRLQAVNMLADMN